MVKFLDSNSVKLLRQKYDVLNGAIQTNSKNISTNATNIKNNTDEIATKQATLVSGTNIRTVNSTSLLGSGNIAVQATLVSGTNIKTVNGNSLLGSGDVSISVPTISNSTGTSTTNGISQKAATDAIGGKQDTLVSGTNIKTVNNNSLLGSGNVSIAVPTISNSTGTSTTNGISQKAATDAISAKQDTLVSGTNIKTINNQSLVGSGNISISVPTISNATGTSTVNGISQKAATDAIAANTALIGDVNTLLVKLDTGAGV